MLVAGTRMHNGPHMNGTAPGPPMPDLDRLVPAMDSSGLGMAPGPPGPPIRGPPPPGVPGIALPDDLTGSEDLNSSSSSVNRQQARPPKGMVSCTWPSALPLGLPDTFFCDVLDTSGLALRFCQAFEILSPQTKQIQLTGSVD